MSRKILALHGYSQNSIIFNKKTGALRRHLRKDKIELVYINAPIILNKDQVHGEYNEDEKPRGWCTFDDNKIYKVEESIEYIKNIIKNEGPFEGIIGFSQGGCILGLLFILNEIEEILSLNSFKYLIFASSFIPKDNNYNILYDKYLLNDNIKVNIPSFHFIGEKDKIIIPEKSLSFSKIFINPIIYKHNGGHYIPANADPMRTLRTFISNNI